MAAVGGRGALEVGESDRHLTDYMGYWMVL